MSEIISIGSTVDEAILEGCRLLGATREECSFEILEMPARKLFRKIPAKVRVTRKEDDFSLASLMSGMDKPEEPEKKEEKPAKKSEKKDKPKTEKKQQPKAEKPVKEEAKEESKAETAEKEEEKPAEENGTAPAEPAKTHKKKKKKKPANKDKKLEGEKKEETGAAADVENADDAPDTSNEILGYLTEEELPERAVCALAYLKDIVKALGFEKVEYALGKTERGVRFILSGDDAPSLIGRRGETMDALQYLCTVGSSREGGDYCRISIDIEGYRSRREEALNELAAKTAAKVKKNGYKQTLEPMNPYERRIVHAAIQEIEGVTSFSVGTEPYRKVVVALEGAPERKGGRKDRKRGGQKSSKGSSHSAGTRTEKTEDAAPVKPVSYDGPAQAYQVITAGTPSAPAETKKAPIPVKKELKSTEEFVGALYGEIKL